MTGRAALPNWVAKRDGRLAPFDGDKVGRAVFAVGERLGRPDPFLARELTDGILHFLAADGSDDPLPTDQLAEVVVKVVRELGHPALAVTYEQYRTAKARRSPSATDAHAASADLLHRLIDRRPTAGELTRRAARAALDSFSRQAVYPRDLVAAERDGLLHLFDCDTPLELVGVVVQPAPPALRPAGHGWVEALEEVRERAGGYVAIDGPEYVLAPLHSIGTVAAWVRELRIGLRLTGLRAVVNLNCPTPPPWATTATSGPLFPVDSTPDDQRRSDLSEALLEHLFDCGPDGLRVDWHLGERDFEPPGRNRLLRLARRALDGAPLAFVTDRVRHPIALAEGLDRQQTAVLGVVGISLTRLVEIVRATTGGGVAPEVYLTKLGSLGRLALSAGHVRREFLRGHARPEVTRGFELERARLVVVPLGLDEAVRDVTGSALSAGGPGLEFARHIFNRLGRVLRDDLARGLPACLDGLPPGAEPCHAAGRRTETGGTVRRQLRAAAALHTEAGAGTAVVQLPPEHRPTPEEVAHLLWYAWQQPGLVRLRFARDVPAARQMSAGW